MSLKTFANRAVCEKTYIATDTDPLIMTARFDPIFIDCQDKATKVAIVRKTLDNLQNIISGFKHLDGCHVLSNSALGRTEDTTYR